MFSTKLGSAVDGSAIGSHEAVRSCELDCRPLLEEKPLDHALDGHRGEVRFAEIDALVGSVGEGDVAGTEDDGLDATVDDQAADIGRVRGAEVLSGARAPGRAVWS